MIPKVHVFDARMRRKRDFTDHPAQRTLLVHLMFRYGLHVRQKRLVWLRWRRRGFLDAVRQVYRFEHYKNKRTPVREF